LTGDLLIVLVIPRLKALLYWGMLRTGRFFVTFEGVQLETPRLVMNVFATGEAYLVGDGDFGGPVPPSIRA
jgi:hypothetical protein